MRNKRRITEIVEEIKKFKEIPDLGEIGNSILYDMCSRYPYHKNEAEIIAKVWLIGRSYAVSIERSKKRKESKDSGQVSDDFYSDIVAPFFKNGFDKKLVDVRKISSITEANLRTILNTHWEAVDFIKGITGDDRRSFVSKYLHFHFRNLFFIYDSRVAGVINSVFREIGGHIKDVKKLRDSLSKYDKAYADFFIRCLYFKKFCEEQRVPLTVRQIDSFLIHRANEKIRNR